METVPSSQGFKSADSFAPKGYAPMPFNFKRLDDGRFVLGNLSGDFATLTDTEFHLFVDGKLPVSSATYRMLHSKCFLTDDSGDWPVRLAASKLATRLERNSELTSLFIFVVTLRCNCSCQYCQVSRQSADRLSFDMSEATAEQAVGLVFSSPCPCIKIEFQGGETLLNFELIKRITNLVEARNKTAVRNVEFVVATNLIEISDEQLTFLHEHSFYVSTSLDGPASLHDMNRPVIGLSSHDAAERNIARVRAALGNDHVSALLTVTRSSLDKPREIVAEYQRQGFHEIFLRAISPFGYAKRSVGRTGYSTDAYIEFFKLGLREIIETNKRGYFMAESATALMLGRIFTPQNEGFVNLQNPAGDGMMCMVFNYDGGVYLSDEGRMLAENGDYTFRLGNVGKCTFRDLLTSDKLTEIVDDTMLEGTVGCHACPYQTLCGADPVYHYATQGRWIGNRATSSFCKRQTAKIEHVLKLLENPEDKAVLMTWLH